MSNDAISRLTPVKVYIEAIDTGSVHVGRSNTLLAYAHNSITKVLIIEFIILVVVGRIIMNHTVVYA